MIYRADFTVDNLKCRLISPVIFGNIAKIYFDIFSEERANKEIDRLISSNTLISDMICKKSTEFKISKTKEDYKKLLLCDEFYNKTITQIDRIKKEQRDFNQDLFKKREQFRKYKEAVKKIELEEGTIASRYRNSINRSKATTFENNLFLHNEYKYDKHQIFSIYVSTNDKYVLDLIEIALKIIEKVGIGTDTSIGNGVLNFIKHEESIFIEDNTIEMPEKCQAKEEYINIASTIITDSIVKEYQIKDYKVKRYDSRTPKVVKPCYYYIECGSILKSNKQPIAKIISNPDKKIKTYTCVFPVKVEGVDSNATN